MKPQTRIKLVIVDLDNTLLKTDSFRLFLNTQLKTKPLRVLFFKSARKLRLITLSTLKYLSVRYLYNLLTNNEKQIFINSLKERINRDIYNGVNNKYSDEYKIIILSASPDEYVKEFAKEIGWDGYGSYYDGETGKYNHLHGTGKIDFVKKYFPPNRYSYTYAISDSPSDVPLLKMFDTYDLLENASHG